MNLFLRARFLIAWVLIAFTNVTFARPHIRHHKGPTVVDAFNPIHQEVVVSVTDGSITIGNKKEKKTYLLAKGFGGTEVYVNNVRSSIAEVRTGMAVTVSGDGSVATTIIVHPEPEHKGKNK